MVFQIHHVADTNDLADARCLHHIGNPYVFWSTENSKDVSYVACLCQAVVKSVRYHT